MFLLGVAMDEEISEAIQKSGAKTLINHNIFQKNSSPPKDLKRVQIAPSEIYRN